MSKHTKPETVIEALEALYSEATAALTDALNKFLHDGTPPDQRRRDEGVFCYPQLRIVYDPEGPPPPISRSFGKFSEAGLYITTITRPAFFRAYLM